MTPRFVYTIDGHTYFLVPTYKVGIKGRVWVESVELYNQENEFVGTWMRYNMPYPLILSLNKFVREYLVRQVKLAPKAYGVRFGNRKKP